MDRQRRRGISYVGLILGVIIAYSVVYSWGMSTFEGEPRTLLQSLHIVVETFTTVGYGEDAPWLSPQMQALMVLMQLSGVFIVFLALPLFVVPWLERRLEVDPPGKVDAENHVVICGFTSRGETLIDELTAKDVEYVIVESDRTLARDLHEDGYPVVYGDPESTETLTDASVEDAQVVVMDDSDETNASIALSVRELAPGVRIIGLVEDPALTNYLHYAGADRVLSPRNLVGRSLAEKVTSAITTRLGDTVEIGEDFEIVELPVQRRSELDGVPIKESRIRERTGVNIIGAWFTGEFESPPSPDRQIDRHTILLVAGRQSQLERLKRLTLSRERRHASEGVIIAGYGEVGSTAHEHLDDEGVNCTVIDIEDKPGVDVVGDATDESTLVEAGIEEASAVILALGDDTHTIFATLVARKLNENVEIICRANETENVQKFYRAGADYVLALATVSGRMLASTVLGEDVVTLDKQIEIVRTEAPRFAGQTLAGADIRSRTGCTVIAVERDGEVLTDIGPDFSLQASDALVVAGTDEDILQFTEASR